MSALVIFLFSLYLCWVNRKLWKELDSCIEENIELRQRISKIKLLAKLGATE